MAFCTALMAETEPILLGLSLTQGKQTLALESRPTISLLQNLQNVVIFFQSFLKKSLDTLVLQQGEYL